MDRVLIGAAGEWPDEATWQPLIDAADFIIAADAGAEQMAARKINADIILGDMDSLAVDDVSKHPDAEIINMPWQTDSDLVKALHWVAEDERFPETIHIDIVGIEGGRPDHALAAYAALFESPSPNTILHLQDWQATAVTEGCEFHCSSGAIVSLFAIGQVKGLSIQGLKYEMKDENMDFSSLGLHNQGMGKMARISISDGKLLMLKEIQTG
ncbi:MAG: thiamine diphosphokinase [Candidatus Poseidoniaceae archaeon]|nr:thiamine diphosphokinase [Candidatus Poseidoniaceae archaeon]